VKVRDIFGKLFKGNDETEDSEAPLSDISTAGDDQEVRPEGETVGGTAEKTIEQTIEMKPDEPVVQVAVDGSGAADGSGSMWPDEDSAGTRPLSSNAQDTLVGISSGEDAGRSDGPASIRAAHRCHVGNKRSRNEDSTFLFTADSGGQEPLLPFGLYIVADGMGGHHAGHEASRAVSRLVASTVLDRIYVPMLESSLSSGGGHQEPILEVIVDAVQKANQQIFNPEPDKDSGTTLTAGLLFGQRIFIAHVGDSRAYLLIDGEMTLLTTDHSYVQRLQDAGQLTEEEAAIHPQRNMLYKAVGQGGVLEIDTITRSLPRKGMLVLCSDGLWGLVDDPQLREVLTNGSSLRAMTDQLINLALQAGGHDNISIVLVEFSF
jgi:serine/threonine protein phosphatase PrpC